MTSASVLLLDDDAAIRAVVGQSLRRAGYAVALAGSLADVRRELDAQLPDVLITDVVLPDGNGLEFAQGFTRDHPDVPVIVLSAQNTLTTAVRATEVGAFDYLPKPFDLEALNLSVAGALARHRAAPVEPIGEEDRELPLIGRSAAMQEVYRVIARVVANDLTVLVSGESGTGKELVARAIHDLGPRRHAPFVAINMAAIPRELIEAELFGHERGAFTGAQARTAGRFEQASSGTLFLDEIGDMPMEAQTRLLRVLQSGEFTTVGGVRPMRADVRIVAATNRDLEQLVTQGGFREDLFYRLNVVPLSLPPLRERREDIALLARSFLGRAAEGGLPHKRLDPDATAVLEAFHWPGNVRQLENIIRRLAVLSRDQVIGAPDIEAALGVSAGARPVRPVPGSLGDAVAARIEELALNAPESLTDGTLYERIIGEVERPLIAAMLDRHGNNQLQAARALGINRNTLRKRLDTLGIDPQQHNERQGAPETR